MEIRQIFMFLAAITSVVLCLLPVSVLASDEEVHWSYAGEDGPEHWGELSDDFRMCLDGRNQSPVNLEQEVHADLPKLVFDYYSKPTLITNNGHTIQTDVEPGGFLRIPSRGTDFELKQFHFHTPSEHTIHGKSYAMEVHFVHANEEGTLAVVGVMFAEGEENSTLSKMRSFMPEHAGESTAPPLGIEETDLLPPTRDYFYYSGSLTTPPCSEGVIWIVLKNAIEASPEQIDLFRTRMGPATNRPVQPGNARMILD